MCGGGKNSINTMVYYWAEIKGKVYGLWERREYKVGYSGETNTSLCVRISIHVLYLYFSLNHCFVSVWVCVCRGRKRREDKQGRNIYQRKRLSLSIIPVRLHLPSVYIRGVRISKNEGTDMGRKEQGCTMRELHYNRAALRLNKQ